MNKNEYQQNWHKRGYSFGVGTVTVEKGVNQASHDDQDELVVVVNGVLEFSVGEKTFVADCDKEVFIPAKSVHSITNIGSEDAVIYYGYKTIN